MSGSSKRMIGARFDIFGDEMLWVLSGSIDAICGSGCVHHIHFETIYVSQ